MKNQCFAYVRVSTVKQGEGVSLEAQREAIERYAQQHQLIVSRWFEEKETAAKQGRPIFTEMVKLLKEGEASGVIMHKIDRSARNLRDWATVGDLQDAGVSVHFAAESVDFASRGGRLTADIQAVIAADYIRNLREETIKGIQGRLKQGIYPFKAPLGYLDNGSGKAKTICPEKGPLVRELFHAYASGAHSFSSLVDLASDLDLLGPKNRPIGKTLIENMLSNPFYIGLIHMKTANKTYQGQHEALISVETFKRVAVVRSEKSVKKRVKHCHKFRRVFSCAFCEKGYVPELQKGHTYYRCHTKGCASLTLREEWLEQALGEKLAVLAIPEELQTRLKSAIDHWTASNSEKDNSGLRAARLKEIETKKEALLDALLDGIIDKATYEARHSKLLGIESQLTKSATRLRENVSIRERVTELFELFKNPYFTYSIAQNEEKRQLLEILCSNLAVRGEKLELATRIWVEKVRNELCAQFGPPVPTTYRSGHGLNLDANELNKNLYDLPEHAVRAVLTGPPVPTTYRSGQGVNLDANDELIELLECEEVEHFISLSRKILARQEALGNEAGEAAV